MKTRGCINNSHLSTLNQSRVEAKAKEKIRFVRRKTVNPKIVVLILFLLANRCWVKSCIITNDNEICVWYIYLNHVFFPSWNLFGLIN